MGSLSPEDVGADVATQHAQGLDAVPVLQPQRAGLPRHLLGHGHRDLQRDLHRDLPRLALTATAAPSPGPASLLLLPELAGLG